MDLETKFKKMYKQNKKILLLCTTLNLEATDEETGEYLNTKDISKLLSKKQKTKTKCLRKNNKQKKSKTKKLQ